MSFFWSFCTLRHKIKSLPSSQIFQSCQPVSHKSFSALINATFQWECETGVRQFLNFSRIFQFLNIRNIRSVRSWLMKYCLCPFDEVQNEDFTFPLEVITNISPSPIINSTRLTHNSVPQLIFLVSSLHVSDVSSLDCLLLSHWLSEQLPIHHHNVVLWLWPPWHCSCVTISLLSLLSPSPQCCGQSRYLVCNWHAEEHLLSSRFKLEISYLKNKNK